MKKEMLINVFQPQECHISILEDGVLEELYVERTSHESYVGNIYKGRIVNIEPSIQAAFVDFGVGRNGCPAVSGVAPAATAPCTSPTWSPPTTATSNSAAAKAAASGAATTGIATATGGGTEGTT